MFDLFAFKKRRTLNQSLLRAAESGDAGRVEELLHQGASANARDPANGRTAAHIAAKLGRLDILKILRQAHANLNLADNDGDLPLDKAIGAKQLDTVKGFFDLGVKLRNPAIKITGILGRR
jgi:ankyrin repeat protein